MSTEIAVQKRTPLYAEHVRLGAKMIDFGGWSMPVQYSGIMDEHRAVRSALGIFDISHMGQIFVSGAGAEAWLNGLLTNNVARLGVGECQYTFLLNEEGGVIDDLIVYRIEEQKYLLVVNAAKIAEDFAWMQQHATAGVQVKNRSEEYAGFAVQGPKAAAFFDLYTGGRQSLPGRNELVAMEITGRSSFIARTGYTGEDGFEIFLPSEAAVDAWNSLLEQGASFGLKPCGLGARDTLRLEMCYPLNGSDLQPDRTPLEAGLSIFVDLNKPSFPGRSRLLAQRAEGLTHRLVPFRMDAGSPPPRAHYAIFKDGAQISEASSGAVSPSLGAGIGMAYLPTETARIGERIEIDIRGRRFPATIEKKPLYRPAADPTHS